MKAHADIMTNMRREYGNEAKSAIISKRAQQERQKHLQRIKDRQVNEQIVVESKKLEDERRSLEENKKKLF